MPICEIYDPQKRCPQVICTTCTVQLIEKPQVVICTYAILSGVPLKGSTTTIGHKKLKGYSLKFKMGNSTSSLQYIYIDSTYIVDIN